MCKGLYIGCHMRGSRLGLVQVEAEFESKADCLAPTLLNALKHCPLAAANGLLFQRVLACFLGFLTLQMGLPNVVNKSLVLISKNAS